MFKRAIYNYIPATSQNMVSYVNNWISSQKTACPKDRQDRTGPGVVLNLCLAEMLDVT